VTDKQAFREILTVRDMYLTTTTREQWSDMVLIAKEIKVQDVRPKPKKTTEAK